MEELNKVHNEDGFMWTVDAKILFKENGRTKTNYFMVKWNKHHIEL